MNLSPDIKKHLRVTILLAVVATIILAASVILKTQEAPQGQQQEIMRATVKDIWFHEYMGQRQIHEHQVQLGTLIYGLRIQIEGENITHKYYMFFGYDEYDYEWCNGTLCNVRYKESKELPVAGKTYDFFYKWLPKYYDQFGDPAVISVSKFKEVET